jgi:hypothetical protein
MLTVSFPELQSIALSSMVLVPPAALPTFGSVAPGTTDSCGRYFEGSRFQAVPEGFTFQTVCHYAAYFFATSLENLLELNPGTFRLVEYFKLLIAS